MEKDQYTKRIGSSANQFIGYEYLEILVKQQKESFYVDGYLNFGWELDKISRHLQPETLTLTFRRDRKIRNKAELTRLQHKFDALELVIKQLEHLKVVKATTVAYLIGFIATALITGSVFAYLGGFFFLSIVLAIPGLVGWVIPYFMYQQLKLKKTIEVSPLIDEKYEEIYSVTKNANGLLPK